MRGYGRGGYGSLVSFGYGSIVVAAAFPRHLRFEVSITPQYDIVVHGLEA